MCSDGDPDVDARPVEEREWDTRASDWTGMSGEAMESWQQQAALVASMQKIPQGATQRSHPTVSNTEGGFGHMFGILEARMLACNFAQTVQFFCIRARDAWSEFEEGRYRQYPFTAATADICRSPTPLPCDRSIQRGPELGSTCASQAVCYAKRVRSAFICDRESDMSIRSSSLYLGAVDSSIYASGWRSPPAASATPYQSYNLGH
jgi:hypothetical protein